MSWMSNVDNSSPPRARSSWYRIHEFDKFDKEDGMLDLAVKASILKAASSVVCLKSYSCHEELFICCGIIMECQNRLGYCVATILTSATLLRPPGGEAKLASDLKIDVYTVGRKSFEGKVVAVDFLYNVAAIEILSYSSLTIPHVKLVDKVVEVGLSVSQHTNDQDSGSTSNRFRLSLGDKVLALARYFKEPYNIMVASGEFSGGRQYNFDCNDLLVASCKIKKNGIGGPLINLHGEVIGINFYELTYTPFLPMNIVMKCFENLKRGGHISCPSLGVMVSDLYTTSLHNLESLCEKFPHVVKGAIINKVLPDSAAHIAGLRVDDIIIKCGGACVGGCVELTEILLGKKHKPIELILVRVNTSKQLQVYVDAVDANPDEYRWPVPEKLKVRIHPLLVGARARPY